MPDLNALRQHLMTTLEATHVAIDDHTPEHAGHPASAGRAHLALTLVSSCFEGRSPLDRHRLVHRAIQADMASWIHAVTLKTHTPGEWQALTPQEAQL